MASLSDQKSERLFKLSGLVEKPGEENTPSSFASVGSYLLTPKSGNTLSKKKSVRVAKLVYLIAGVPGFQADPDAECLRKYRLRHESNQCQAVGHQTPGA